MKPAISVYLATRNRADLLRNAVNSVSTQTFQNFELILVDDASDDETPRVLAELEKKDERIRWFRFDSRKGASAARNLAIQEAQGEWCTGIDDDDLMTPSRLSLLYAATEVKKQFSLICTGFYLERAGRRRRINCRNSVITLDDLLHRNIIGNQALFRRQHALEISGFDPEMPASQDYDFWTRLIKNFGDGIRIKEPTYVFREHSHASQRISVTGAALLGAQRYTEKHRSIMSCAHLRTQRLVHSYVAGDPLTLRLAMENMSPKNIPFLARYAASRFFAGLSRKKLG